MRTLLLAVVPVVLSLGCGATSPNEGGKDVEVKDGGVKVNVGVPDLIGKKDREKKAALPSVAVLPVKSSSAITKLSKPIDALSETLGANLTKLLSRYPELDVKAQSVVREWKNYDPVQAGRSLQVGSVLVTEIKSQDETIVITVEMMEVPGGRQRWSEVYREKYTTQEKLNEFEDKITKEIASAVAENLGVKVAK